jgi:hypothetical protein
MREIPPHPMIIVFRFPSAALVRKTPGVMCSNKVWEYSKTPHSLIIDPTSFPVIIIPYSGRRKRIREVGPAAVSPAEEVRDVFFRFPLQMSENNIK